MAAVWHPISANVCKTGGVTTAPVVSGCRASPFVPPRRHTLPTRAQVLRTPGQPRSRVPLQPAASSGGVVQWMGQSQAWRHVWGPGDRDRN